MWAYIPLFDFVRKNKRITQSCVNVYTFIYHVTEKCKPDYGISGPLVIEDSKLTASSVYDLVHDAMTARLRPVTAGITPLCWKPSTSDTNQWIQVIPFGFFF